MLWLEGRRTKDSSRVSANSAPSMETDAGRHEGSEPRAREDRPLPSKESLLTVLKETQDNVAKLAEKREDRMIRALVGAGGLVLSFFALWAAVPPTQDDLARVAAYVALFVMLGELLLAFVVPTIIREKPDLQLRRGTFKRMMMDATRRSLTFRLLCLLAVVLLLPLFNNYAGYLFVLLVGYNLAADINTFFMSDERLLEFQRMQATNLARNPKRNQLMLGIIPLLLYLYCTWAYLVEPRAIVAAQLALPLIGIILLAFYSTFVWAFERSAAEIQQDLSGLRTSLMMGTASVEETLEKMRVQSTSDTVEVFPSAPASGK